MIRIQKVDKVNRSTRNVERLKTLLTKNMRHLVVARRRGDHALDRLRMHDKRNAINEPHVESVTTPENTDTSVISLPVGIEST